MLAREEILRKLHDCDEYYRRRARQSFAAFIGYTKSDYALSWRRPDLLDSLASGLGRAFDRA